MDTKQNNTKPMTAIQRRGLEDLKPGDHVAIARVLVEMLPWGVESDLHTEVRVPLARVMPRCAGHPYRVVRVCAPFVLVQDPRGRPYTFDVRRHELVVLPAAYARKAFQLFREHDDRQAPDDADA